MWSVANIINNTNPPQAVAFSDGMPLNAVRGGAGNCFRLMVNALGFLDITDTGHVPGGPHYWQLIINGSDYWYDGQGAINITLNNDGSFQITGDGNSFSGILIPFPTISGADIQLFDLMLESNLVPYQLIPDEPGKTTAQLEALGLQYFPFTPDCFQLAMSVYDWTTADFTRIQFLLIFAYTGVQGQPLDMESIAEGIWTSNWQTYNPQNVYYMNSFMMQPAQSLIDVQNQLSQVASNLRAFNAAEVNLLQVALTALPRTSCLAVPKLYSGQVDISNLGPEHFATYFYECPLNSDPSLPSLQMPLEEALASFIEVGKNLTLKGFMSFTDSEQDALHYSNGILVIVSPPPGAVYWESATFITPLSDGPEKIEYLYHPASTFSITNIASTTVGGKQITEIYLQAI